MLVLIFLVLFFLIACSAVFSAIETALFSLQPFHLERLKSQKGDFPVALSRLMEDPRRLLSAILIADVLVNLPLVLLGLYLLRTFVPEIGFWEAALWIFMLVVFVCDLVPKFAAIAQPERVAKVGVQVMRVLMPVIDPICRLLQRVSERISDALTPTQVQPNQFLSEEELETLVEVSAEQGALHETESEMIQEIIKLGDKTAKDCMTPRVDTFAVPDDFSNEELIPKLRAKRHQRVPVYGETPDEILGILDVREFLLDPSEHYTERLSAPSFVAETMKAVDLLRSFLSHPQALAIVVDEYGGTEGVVTLADLVEEIISDALPRGDHSLYIERLGERQILANGSARIDDINEELGTNLEEEGIDTIGGLIFNRMGVLPKPGEHLKICGVDLTVRRTSRKRIEEVLIEQCGEAGGTR